MSRLRVLLTPVLLAALALVAMPAAASAADRAGSHDHLIVRVWHAPTTPTAILGSGLGTVRTWFVPIAVDGVSAPTQFMTGTLTTTAVDPANNVEWRASNLDFVLGAEADQLVIGGTSSYATANATITAGTKTVRPVVGASGKYAGYTGYAVTTNMGSSGWLHVFHLQR